MRCCKEELTIQAEYFTNANIIQIQIHRPLAWKPGPIILIADGIWLVPSAWWRLIIHHVARVQGRVRCARAGGWLYSRAWRHVTTAQPSSAVPGWVQFSRVPQCWSRYYWWQLKHILRIFYKLRFCRNADKHSIFNMERWRRTCAEWNLLYLSAVLLQCQSFI